MSTRCMIEVKDSNVKIYRHSDGYPDSECGVLATLVPQVKKFLALRSWDPEYMLARIAQWQMNVYDKATQEGGYFNQSQCLGFGLDTRYHGDLEYIYRIEPTVIKVYQFNGVRKGKLLQKIPL